MLNFSFLRQHVPDLLPIAVPVGLAVLVHGVWIGFSPPQRRLDAESGITVDNTAQLVRITRRVVQQQTLPAVGLDLSGTLPPPPPDLLIPVGDPPEAAAADCPPQQDADGSALRSDGADVAESSSAPKPTPSQSQPRNEQKEVADADLLPPAGTPEELAWIERLWNRAFGVPIWPKQLGPRQPGVNLREISLEDLGTVDVEELLSRSLAQGDVSFALKLVGDRLFILKKP